MEELINKYIRRHLRIEDNTIDLNDAEDTGYPIWIARDVRDVFCLKEFELSTWCVENLGNPYYVRYSDGLYEYYLGSFKYIRG